MQKPKFKDVDESEPGVKHEQEAKRFRNFYQVICIICSSIIFIISSYGIVASIAGHIDIVGASLVNIEVPSVQFSPITVKPISVLIAAALGLTYSGLELAKPTVMRFSKLHYSIIKMLAFVAAALSAYEVLYNFTIWTAEITQSSILGFLNPDNSVNGFPNPAEPWNLVFATKLTVAGVAIALYIFYYIIKLEREKEKQKDRLALEEAIEQMRNGRSRDFIER